MHQNLPFFMKNWPKMAVFWSKINFFLAPDKQLKTPLPILRVLDAKKQVVEAYRSRKHNLQHVYTPKFPIFHEKNGQKWQCFGLKLSFSASEKQLKTSPPIVRVLDAKKQMIGM